MDDGHARTVEEVLSHFKADPERGLSLDQVKEYQKKYGPNGKKFIELNSIAIISGCCPKIASKLCVCCAFSVARSGMEQTIRRRVDHCT